MAQFKGDYKLISSENFEPFMQALGVNYLLRKIGNTTKPTLNIETDGHHFKMTSDSTFKKIIAEFNLGEEFDDTSPDGRKTKNVMTLSGDVLTHVEKSEDGKETTYLRELMPDGDMKVTCTHKDVVAIRVYKRTSPHVPT